VSSGRGLAIRKKVRIFRCKIVKGEENLIRLEVQDSGRIDRRND
jgi:hypothetical protein